MPGTQLTDWIDARAKAAGTTSSAVASRAGLNKATVSKWRNGQSPAPKDVRAVALALGAPVLEAFVAAGFLLPDDTGRIVEVTKPASELSNGDLAKELQRRMDSIESHRKFFEILRGGAPLRIGPIHDNNIATAIAEQDDQPVALLYLPMANSVIDFRHDRSLAPEMPVLDLEEAQSDTTHTAAGRGDVEVGIVRLLSDLSEMNESTARMVVATRALLQSGEPLGPHLESLNTNLAAAKRLRKDVATVVDQYPGVADLEGVREGGEILERRVAELEALHVEMESRLDVSTSSDDNSAADEEGTYAARLGIEDVVSMYGITRDKPFQEVWEAGYRAKDRPLLLTAMNAAASKSGEMSGSGFIGAGGPKFWRAFAAELGGTYKNGLVLPPPQDRDELPTAARRGGGKSTTRAAREDQNRDAEQADPGGPEFGA